MSLDFLDPDIDALQEDLIRIRRHIHANPESGADQPKTVRFLVEELDDLDVSLKYGNHDTGLVVEIVNGEGPTIAFRADMDALELHETDDPDHLPNKLGFRSRNEGRMHACGHDVHTAILIGLGKVLHKHRDKIRGKIRLLFQPGEEGYNGARRMIDEGHLKGVDHVFALHCFPHLSVGELAYRKGAMFASIDTFQVTITGIGGHGSAPEIASDQVLALCRVVNDIQSIVSRRISALDSAVLSICYVNAGNKAAITVIPEKAEFTGSIRSFKPEIQERIREELFSVCLHSAKSVHAACEVKVEYQKRYLQPSMIQRLQTE